MKDRSNKFLEDARRLVGFIGDTQLRRAIDNQLTAIYCIENESDNKGHAIHEANISFLKMME